ncbi:hypothetical protein FACS189472_13570 [Alphaproteobacteria bacterium]|nr:hypothetical protein FACS189472_13570 [Alphaproteobacteria bacterium]
MLAKNNKALKFQSFLLKAQEAKKRRAAPLRDFALVARREHSWEKEKTQERKMIFLLENQNGNKAEKLGVRTLRSRKAAEIAVFLWKSEYTAETVFLL